MATVLAIPNASFYANAIELIPFTEFIPRNISDFYLLYINYQGASNIRQAASNESAASVSKILVADVSGFVGRTIKITSANPIVSDAYYDCFTASLGDIEYNDIPSMGVVQTAILHAITPIGQPFNVSVVAKKTNTIQTTIPTGANYLIVTANFDNDLTDAKLKVELV